MMYKDRDTNKIPSFRMILPGHVSSFITAHPHVPPELILPSKRVSGKSDIYSFGRLVQRVGALMKNVELTRFGNKMHESLPEMRPTWVAIIRNLNQTKAKLMQVPNTESQCGVQCAGTGKTQKDTR